MWIHPTFDKTMGQHPDLSSSEKLFGFHITQEDYDRFRKEADTSVPYLDDSGKHLWAVYNSHRHPESAPMQRAYKARKPLPPTSNYHILWIVQILILLMILFLLVTRGHAQGAAGVGGDGQNAAVTFLPLSDADKIKFLMLGKAKDGYIEQKLSLQIETDKVDKLLAKSDDDINQAAQELAKRDKIDTTLFILDLDKYGWVTKESK